MICSIDGISIFAMRIFFIALPELYMGKPWLLFIPLHDNLCDSSYHKVVGVYVPVECYVPTDITCPLRLHMKGLFNTKLVILNKVEGTKLLVEKTLDEKE